MNTRGPDIVLDADGHVMEQYDCVCGWRIAVSAYSLEEEELVIDCPMCGERVHMGGEI